MNSEDNRGSRSKTLGCSIRGQKNVDKGIPCQDDNYTQKLPGNKYVIAVADGLGSASQSHIGSKIATQAVVNYVEREVTGTEPLNEKKLQSVLNEAFVHARGRLYQKADSEEIPVSNLNTTLLVAVGGPAGVAGAAVGDGGVVCRRGGQTGLVIPREDTEYENKTIPIQSDNWKKSYRFGWVADADAAAVFSDGLDGVAWDGPASVSDKLFDQIFESIRDYSDLDELEEFLEGFLDGESLRKSSRDDKTLVAGALPNHEWTDPADVEQPVGILEDRKEKMSTEASIASSTPSSGQSAQQIAHDNSDLDRESMETDERVEENEKSRGIGVVGIGILAGALVLAVLLTGGFFESGETGEISELSAELNGADGLVITGNASGGAVDTLNVTVLKKVNNESIYSETLNSSGDGDQFNLSLEPRKLTEGNNFDYYDTGTEYIVEVQAENLKKKKTSVERGEISVSIDNITESKATIHSTLKQGGIRVHEAEPNIQAYYGDTELKISKITNTKDSNQVELHLEEGVDVDPTASNLTLRFAGKSDQQQVNLANFNVNITGPDEPVAADKALNVSVNVTNAGIANATKTIELINSSRAVVGSEELKINSSDTRQLNITWNPDSDSADASTEINVRSGTDFDTHKVTFKQPAFFNVSITETKEPVAGEPLEVSVDVTNEGEMKDKQTVDLTDTGFGDAERDNNQVTLAPGESESITLEWYTSIDQAGNGSVTVFSDDNSTSTMVNVTELPEFSVSKVSTNGPVQEGNTLEVTAHIENVGDSMAEQTIKLKVDSLTSKEENVTLQGGKSKDVDFSVETETGDTGTYTLNVSTYRNNNATESVTISGEGQQPEDGTLESPRNSGPMIQSVDQVGLRSYRSQLMIRENPATPIIHSPTQQETFHNGGAL